MNILMLNTKYYDCIGYISFKHYRSLWFEIQNVWPLELYYFKQKTKTFMWVIMIIFEKISFQ